MTHDLLITPISGKTHIKRLIYEWGCICLDMALVNGSNGLDYLTLTCMFYIGARWVNQHMF